MYKKLTTTALVCILGCVAVNADDQQNMQITITDATEDIQHLNNEIAAQRIADAIGMGHTEAAITYAQKILSQKTNNTYLREMLAMALYYNQDLEQAAAQYKKVIEQSPQNRNVVQKYIKTLESISPQEAIKLLKNMYSSRPDITYLPAHIARLYSTVGDYVEATRYYALAITINPNNIYYQYNFAVSLDKAEMTKKAIDAYTALLKKTAISQVADKQKIAKRIIALKKKLNNKQ